MIYLQVQGQSQLLKEIQETSQMTKKVIDDGALHRNEVTFEVEELDQPEASARPKSVSHPQNPRMIRR